MIVRMPVSHTRPLTVSDLDLVVRHRKGMFREMGRPEEELAAMSDEDASETADRMRAAVRRRK